MKGKEVLRGMSGNKGTVVCKLRIIPDDPEMGEAVPAKLKAIQEGECIVAVKTVPAQEPYLDKAAAIIQNSGGKLSHGNVYASTRGKPSIYNTQGVVQSDGSTFQIATDVLKDGMEVVVEGYSMTVEEEQGDGSIKRRNYGIIYEHVPDTGTPSPAAGAAKPSLSDLMAKYGMQQR